TLSHPKAARLLTDCGRADSDRTSSLLSLTFWRGAVGKRVLVGNARLPNTWRCSRAPDGRGEDRGVRLGQGTGDRVGAAAPQQPLVHCAVKARADGQAD